MSQVLVRVAMLQPVHLSQISGKLKRPVGGAMMPKSPPAKTQLRAPLSLYKQP